MSVVVGRLLLLRFFSLLEFKCKRFSARFISIVRPPRFRLHIHVKLVPEQLQSKHLKCNGKYYALMTVSLLLAIQLFIRF